MAMLYSHFFIIGEKYIEDILYILFFWQFVI